MFQSKFWYFWLGAICLFYFLAIGVDTMDVDASQYASMSREMKVTGSYLQVYEQGKDYLDKPPFLFWINAVSMHVFGENNFAFKLPSILFAILGIICTYKLARIYYDHRIAKMAAFILASSQALFLITNDIRTDTILMGWVSLALWLLTKWYREGGVRYFLLGCAAVGGGMITKGPIALMVPIFALGSQVLLHRKFSYFFRKEYLIGLLIIAVILLPMCIGLYQQFDLHPEKTMYGRQGTSGLRFFFWTQSFGRITGESVWDNGAPFSFLFENLLWGFLPWTIFMIGGLLTEWYVLVKSKFRLSDDKEGLCIAGFTITYGSLASSNYQLPHYIYVALPLLSVITAKFMSLYLYELGRNIWRMIISRLHLFALFVICLIPALILLFIFPSTSVYIWMTALLPICFLLIYLIFGKKVQYGLFNFSILIFVTVNLFISLWFYPTLLSYQAGNVVGRLIEKMNIAEDAFFKYQFGGSAWNIHFYSKRIVREIDHPFELNRDIYIITGDSGLNEIKKRKKTYQMIYNGVSYPVSQLTFEFVNKETRAKTLTRYYLIKLVNS